MTTLITGASRGIGAGLLAHYRASGEKVIGTARGDVAGLERLDVTDPASQAALAARLGDTAIDFLVCNAGVYLDKGYDLASYGADTFADTFAANVTGVFMTIQALLPHLERASAPRIAIISSVMASSARAPGHAYAYRASKAAAVNLGRNLAVDLKPRGVAIGIYHPGWVRTDMGGSEADIGIDESVNGLATRFAELDIASTGAFLSYDGTPIPF